jgi:hypothetical protein
LGLSRDGVQAALTDVVAELNGLLGIPSTMSFISMRSNTSSQNRCCGKNAVSRANGQFRINHENIAGYCSFCAFSAFTGAPIPAIQSVR